MIQLTKTKIKFWVDNLHGSRQIFRDIAIIQKVEKLSGKQRWKPCSKLVVSFCKFPHISTHKRPPQSLSRSRLIVNYHHHQAPGVDWSESNMNALFLPLANALGASVDQIKVI
jgi:hypothetical protein